MLAKIPSPDLRVDVVWMPILRPDDEEAAAKAAAALADPRAHHFWNPDSEVGREASRALRIVMQMDLAWDVFLVYGPDVRWAAGTSLPAPTAWMHHLTEGDPRWMTPEGLSRVISALLPEPKPAPAKPSAR